MTGVLRPDTRCCDSPPVICAHDLDLVARLRRVRVHERRMLDATAPPPLRAGRGCTTPRSAARRRRAYDRSRRRASACAAPGSRRATPAWLLAAAGGTSASASIMHLPIVGPHAALGHSLEHDVGIVHRLHRQHRRGAAERAARSSPGVLPPAAVSGGVRRFHRPDARAQPLHQRQVVGVAAEQGLAEVDVRLDRSRAARSRRARRWCGRAHPSRTRADGGDPPVADRQVAVRRPRVVVHVTMTAVADQQRHGGG